MKILSLGTVIVLVLINQVYASSSTVDSKTQETDLKVDAKELIKAAASSAEYSALAADYATEKQESTSSSSSSSNSESGSYSNVDSQQQYSQPLSYSQPGTPVQPVLSYSQPLNYASQALPYTSESSQSQTYGSSDVSNNVPQPEYAPIKDIPEIPSSNGNSNYYPQYPVHQQYNPQQQGSAQSGDYQNSQYNAQSNGQQYDNNHAQQGYNQPMYVHNQHHMNVPMQSYSEHSYISNSANNYQGPSYSQPLPADYSQDYSQNSAQPQMSPVHNIIPAAPIVSGPVKPKKTVILAIPVKLVTKSKYTGQNNGYAVPEPQPHYSANVIPAAANLPVTHSAHQGNNYYSSNGVVENNYEKQNEKLSFNEKPLYNDKPAYAEKNVEDYQKVNHNLNNNLQNNGYNNGNEYEMENNESYGRNQNHGSQYNNVYKPSNSYQAPNYNAVKPLSNYQHRPRKNYNNGDAYGSDNGHSGNAEEEITVSNQEHGYHPNPDMEHNPLHSMPMYHQNKHKINEMHEPIDYMPSGYFPPEYHALGGPITGISSYSSPIDLIYNPYKQMQSSPLSYKPSYGLRPSLLGSSSTSSPSSSSSSSNYGQFLSSLLNAYSLGGLKTSSSTTKPQTTTKNGLASYFSSLDLLKGYSSLSPSYAGSLLASGSGLNKYYLPSSKPSAKPSYVGWPSEINNPSKSKPTGLLASSSNIVSSIDELFKSSLNPTSKFKRPLYSDATRVITNFYKKLLN